MLHAPAGGSVLVSGPLSGAASLTAASPGSGNVSLAPLGNTSNSGFTGSTIVQSGQLTLDYSQMTPSGGTVGGILPNSPLVLGSGTLAFNGNPSAAVNDSLFSTTVTNYGSTVVNLTPGRPVQIGLGAITRNSGLLDLPVNTTTFTTSNSNALGILGGYLTVNGDQGWAAVSGGTIAALGSYQADSYLAGNNVDVTNLALGPTGTATVNSLRFNTPTGGTLTLGGATTLTSGGILVTPNVAANSVTLSGGALTASGTTSSNTLADVVVVQGNTAAPFTIASAITDNGGTSIGLTKGGPGALVLTGSNTFTGPIRVAAGTLQLGDGTPGHDTLLSGNIANNGTLLVDTNANQSYAGTISGLGSFSKGGTGTLTLTRTSTYSGPTVINSGNAQTGLEAPPRGSRCGHLHRGSGVRWEQQPRRASLIAFRPSTTSLTACRWNSRGTTVQRGRSELHRHDQPGELFRQHRLRPLLPRTPWDRARISRPSSAVTSTCRRDSRLSPPAGRYHGSTLFIDGNLVVNNNNYQGMTLASGSETSCTPDCTRLSWPIRVARATDCMPRRRSRPTTAATNALVNGSAVGQVFIRPRAEPAATISSRRPRRFPSPPAATLDLGGASQQVASLSDIALGSGGSIINSNTASGSVLTLSPSGGSTTFSGTIDGSQGPISLVMSGSGTQVLNGSLLGSGSLSVSAGTLVLGGVNPMVGITTLSGGALQVANPLALEGQTLDINTSDLGTLSVSDNVAQPGRPDGNAEPGRSRPSRLRLAATGPRRPTPAISAGRPRSPRAVRGASTSADRTATAARSSPPGSWSRPARPPSRITFPPGP